MVSPRVLPNVSPILEPQPVRAALMEIARALYDTFQVLLKTDDKGLGEPPEDRAVNRFGQKSIMLDVVLEDRVIALVKQFVKAGAIPSAGLYSEEMKAAVRYIFEQISGNGPCNSTLLLDGLDGSGHAKFCVSNGVRGEYATILGLYQGGDPCFSDAFASLAIQYGLGLATICIGNERPYQFPLRGAFKRIEIPSGGILVTPKALNVVIDPNFFSLAGAEEIKEAIARKHNLIRNEDVPACSAAHMLRVVCNRGPEFGTPEDVFLRRIDTTKLLEFGALMRIILNLGGVVLSASGHDLRDQNVRKFLDKSPDELIIVARNEAIGRRFARDVSEHAMALRA